MKTPAFWSSKNLTSNLLLPFSFLYELIGNIQRTYTLPAKFPIPIVCIGNLIAGGSGKTPVALHIGQLFKEKEPNAFFLTRGYGGRERGPILVDPKKHTLQDIGDEPLLLAHVLPTVVSKNRLAGARFALQKGARVIIMDDGFQNPAIAKSLSLIVIDGKVGFGNERLIPAGPLRERPSIAFKRAHGVIIINRSTSIPPLPKEMLVLSAKTQLVDAQTLKGKKLFAFCGLAYPHKFFDMLTGTGAKVVGTQSFPDHYPYRDIDMNKLLSKSVLQDAALITTAKDAVRIPREFRDCVAVADMTIAFDEPALLDGVIDFIVNPPKTP